MLTKRPVPLVVARLSGPGNSRERHSTPPMCAAHPRNAVCTPAACQTSVRLHEKRAITLQMEKRIKPGQDILSTSAEMPDCIPLPRSLVTSLVETRVRLLTTYCVYEAYFLITTSL